MQTILNSKTKDFQQGGEQKPKAKSTSFYKGKQTKSV